MACRNPLTALDLGRTFRQIAISRHGHLGGKSSWTVSSPVFPRTHRCVTTSSAGTSKHLPHARGYSPVLSSSTRPLGLRHSYSTTPPSSVSPAHTIPPPGSDAPLTSFQTHIASLETRLAVDPDNLSLHLELLRSLLSEGETAGLVRYYDVVALRLDPSSGEDISASEHGNSARRSEALLRSDEAWNVYVEALGRGGRLGQVAGRVRRRDWLLSQIGIAPSSPASAPGAASSGAQVTGEGKREAGGWFKNFLSGSGRGTSANTTSAPGAAAGSGTALSEYISPSGEKGATTPASTGSFASATGSPGSSSHSHQPPSPSALGTSGGGSGSPVAGTPLSPLYVQLAPPAAQFSVARTARWLLGTLFWIFVALTILSVIMENTGLLKAGPGPVEFEAEEGKVVKFSDVHGCEEAKSELEEIVEFLKNPDKFSTLGGKLPKGVLLTGPPGTGKTMLARAVAGEAGVPFLFASGSQFDEMFVGVGAKRIRELFGAAKKKAPAIVFIDELDAIGSKRSAKDAHYMKQTLNQLLVELDGFEQMEGVIIIAATNFPESLDKALTRPGRFDRHVVVGLPDVRGRIAILQHHMGEVAYDVDVDASVIARGCPGMSGADLQNLVNQAAVKASREGSKTVRLSHFEWAKDRILMGAERRSHYVTEESKRATAYHEGGHALVAMHTPGAMPLHKVTIMPRGQALGITFQLPEQDKDSYTRKEFAAMIDVALGGRAAEEMIFGHDDVTSGCSSDLQRATDVATRMIRSYGFSDKVGLVAHGDEESVYLSGKKKDEIEGEIRAFLDKGMGRARGLLKHHEEELHQLAKALVEYETLSLDEVRQVLAGKKLDRAGAAAGAKLMGEHEKKGEAGQVVDGI